MAKASIEYMRYLEQCISDLKIAHSRRDSPSSTTSDLPPPPLRRMRDDDEDDDIEDDGDQAQDEEMEDAASPTFVGQAPSKYSYSFANASPAMYPSDRSIHNHSTITSPAIMPHDRNGQHSANPSPTLHPSDPHRYSLAQSVRSTVTSPSIHPSPVFGAQTPSAMQFSKPFHNGPPSTGPIAAPGSSHGPVHFSLMSPALKPQAEREDQEATEALLMLNTDRRSWSGARGMSVKDLLSG
ncbi:HLH transcription factor [Pyrenophora seminiperda CCB06]|uniref:HLH transcription factor n=1 Tax=Pyrenophora seminiperda CCB06 TaxID=1302712 RepID=A0A3M7M3U2_9PLEO|nr:HLH transcription factor [Pyrenophora seminiperda CCB06]